MCDLLPLVRSSSRSHFALLTFGCASQQVHNEDVSWLAVGFSENEMMIGSDAVIFRPDSGKVFEYTIYSQVQKGSNATVAHNIFRRSEVLQIATLFGCSVLFCRRRTYCNAA